MNLDEKIISAIEGAVKNVGQDEQLSVRLLAWLHDLAEGNETFENKKAIAERVFLLYDAVDVAEADVENE